MEPELRRLWMWHALRGDGAQGGRLRHLSGRRRDLPDPRARDAPHDSGLSRRYCALSDPASPSPDPSQVGNPIARTMVDGWVRLWVYPGLFRPLIPAYLDYFRPGFHPLAAKTEGISRRSAPMQEFSTPEPKGHRLNEEPPRESRRYHGRRVWHRAVARCQKPRRAGAFLALADWNEVGVKARGSPARSGAWRARSTCGAKKR